MAKIWRQGDIILRRIESVDETIVSKIREGNKISDILSIGGETGKRHVMEVPVYNVGGQMMIILDKQEELKHEEHKSLEIPAGVYTVGRVRDYLRNQYD